MPVEGRDHHPVAHRDHARLHRQAVGDDGALRALAVRAEDALRRAVLVVVPEDADAVGEERRRNRLAVEARHGLAVPGEGDRLTRLDGEDRMFTNAVLDHDVTPMGAGYGRGNTRAE